MEESENKPIEICERDGFPILPINGEPHCLAEFVNFCIGGQKITDVILRHETIYYVFENRHEFPLLCFCCGSPLACEDIQLEKKQLRGRKLQAMTWSTEEVEEGRFAISYLLEFSSKHGETEPLMVQTSVLSADKMVHPILCAHSGVSLPDTSASPVVATLPSHKRRKRR
jgi:hypothetical protein